MGKLSQEFTMSADTADLKAAKLVVGGDLLLYGDVGDMWGDGSGFSADSVVRAVAAMHGPFTCRLNSGGGLVTDGVAIYNALKNYTGGPVTMQVDGMAASAASLIAMASDKRVMCTGAMMMIHDPAGISIGPASEHTKTAAILDKMANTFAEIYAKASGKSETDVRQMMMDETWMTADEAVEAGFASEVMPEEEIGATSATFAPFDYLLYTKAPDKAKAAQRALPTALAATAANAKRSKESIMNKTEAEAKAAADKLIADATAAAAAILTAAKDKTAADQVTAKADADRIVAEANAAAAAIVTEQKSQADVTRQIMERASTAGLTLKETLEIVTEAKGKLGKAKDLIIDAIAAKAGDQRTTTAVVVADVRDRFVAGATKGLLFRASMKDGERNEFAVMTLRELARHALSVRNNTKVFNDPMQMVSAAFAPVMAGPGLGSTSDFSEILANVANKSMLKGWDEAEETFQLWTAVGTLVDFKPAKRVDLNIFPTLAEVPEGAEYTTGTIGDRGETIQLASYGKMFGITRQAIINDDLNAFTRIPQKMGRASRRTIGDLAYAVLTANAAMADGHTLFGSDHSNFLDSTLGAPPSVATVNAGLAAMALQSDPDNNASGGLNIVPKYLLVPIELRGTAQALMRSQNDPAATTPNVVNTVQGLAEVVSDARLSKNSAKAWYLAANPNQYDTIEVAYLNGNQTPVMEQREGWYTDGVEFKIRIDAGVKALDFRGLVKNKGES